MLVPVGNTAHEVSLQGKLARSFGDTKPLCLPASGFSVLLENCSEIFRFLILFVIITFELLQLATIRNILKPL